MSSLKSGDSGIPITYIHEFSNMLASIDTPQRPTMVAPHEPTLRDVVTLLVGIQQNQQATASRIGRVETRLVNLLMANGLDRNGKPGGEPR